MSEVLFNFGQKVNVQNDALFQTIITPTFVIVFQYLYGTSKGDLDDCEYENMQTSTEQLGLCKKLPEHWTGNYSYMNSIENQWFLTSFLHCDKSLKVYARKKGIYTHAK